jgi:hypothetical protein
VVRRALSAVPGVRIGVWTDTVLVALVGGGVRQYVTEHVVGVAGGAPLVTRRRWPVRLARG